MSGGPLQVIADVSRTRRLPLTATTDLLATESSMGEVARSRQVPRSRMDPKVRAARSRRRAVPFSGVPLRYVKNTDAYQR
jgi:hypothetical protein